MTATDDSAQNWQRKYYDSLEDFERKEKQWAGVEDLLRRTISRLTLAADGLDDSLDRQLKELRDAIRDREDSRTLTHKIEAMSRTLVKLDREKAAKPAAEPPVRLLLRLLDDLQLPRGTGRQVKQLRKDLEQAGPDTVPDPLIKSFASLLASALELATETMPDHGETVAAKEGLFKRLFSKGDTASPPGPNPEPDPLEPARRLLAGLMEQAGIQDLRQRALRAEQARELEQLGTELIRGLRADATPPAAAPEAALEEPAPDTVPDRGSSDIALEELLLQLLEQLQLPAEFSTRAESLQERLERPAPDTDWSALLGEIAGMVGEMRNRIQEEKRALEDFLKQVTERLQEVDEHLHGSEAFREASLRNSRDLDAAVKQEVRGIESSVRDAADLEQLKSEVQGHLENIVSQLEEHERKEELSHRNVHEEVSRLQQRLRDMEAETEQLRVRVREERSQALTDSLTGIPNRMAYDERIRDEVARWKRFRTPLALLVWDVDKFKAINDQYGHKAGDKVLRTVALTLQEQVRETDFLARFGGEEFVLIMTGTELPSIQDVADKLRGAVEACGFHFRGNSVQVTISCGIALFRESDTPEAVFERADQALYRAKENGRNRCEIEEQ